MPKGAESGDAEGLPGAGQHCCLAQGEGLPPGTSTRRGGSALQTSSAGARYLRRASLP